MVQFAEDLNKLAIIEKKEKIKQDIKDAAPT